MNFLKASVVGGVLALASAAALATPQYWGNTTASGDLALNQGNGYYIWNDIDNPANWSVRWTAPDADSEPVSWFGNIEFTNSNLETYSEFQFTSEDVSARDDDLVSMEVEWTTLTNNTGGIDGINFTLGNGFELMRFSLGSSLFSGLALEGSDPGVTATGIYIGSDYALPNVLVLKNGVQHFEVSVPEPGTLALLGAGLLGLGIARRRKA